MSETDPVKYFESETKRLNYYNSQFLKEEDFRDEQLYHSQMRRFHNRSLHTWGVVAGLKVTQVAGSKQVTVGPGTAIDRLGREIVLPREVTLPQQGGLTQDAVSFDEFDAGSQVYLTINYGEATDQADRDAQGNNYTRTVERPKLSLSASAPAEGESGVVIATIRLDKDKLIAPPGTESRRYAGSRIGSSSDGKEFSVFADGEGAWHFFDGSKGADRLTLDGKGNLKLSDFGDPSDPKDLKSTNTGGNLQLGTRNEIYFKDNGQIRSRDNAHRILLRRDENKLELREYGDLIFSPGATDGNETAKVVMSSDGSVIIGRGKDSKTGAARLDVNGEAWATSLRITGADGKPHEGNGLWMANNLDDATKWLHVGGITEAGVRRLALVADRTYITGNVGIGTATPEDKLHVGTGYAKIGLGSTPDQLPHSLYNVDFGTAYVGLNALRTDKGWHRDSDSRNNGGSIIYNTIKGDLCFVTLEPSAKDYLPVTDVTARKRMVISSLGNVGIGTPNPLVMLQVGKEGSEGSPSIRVGWGANNNEDRLSIYNSDGYNMGLRRGSRDLRIFSKSPDGDGHIHLMPNNAVAMSLLSSGCVGVGTTDAPARLTIRSVVKYVPLGEPMPAQNIGDGNLYDITGTAPFGPIKTGDFVKIGDEVRKVTGASPNAVRLESPFKTSGMNAVPVSRVRVTSEDIFRADDQAGNPALFVSGDGNVGVGTNSPTRARLEVRGSIDSDVGNYRFVAADQISTYRMTAPYSIYAERRVAAEEFNAFSDERIKLIEGRSDAARDLSTLMGIEITDYRYKDVIGGGNDTRKKVVGQQVEKVFPQAISKHTDVVPDIYRQASIHDGWVALATDLKKGERVKLITEKGEEGVYEVLEVAQDKFRVAFKHEAEKVFVFGREVNDFLTVDYDAIAMLNVSATQQLKREKDEAVKALWAENAELKAANDALTKRLQLLESKTETILNLAAAKSGSNGNGRH